jgi:Domain of unknown function (DUF5916)/Carbohydrate family 9 binding domain-like
MRQLPLLTLLVCLALPLFAEEKARYDITRVGAAVTVDGVIDAAEWANVKPIDLAFETFPGNNIAARVKTEAYLGYDDKNLYVGFRAFDPNPRAIRAHLTDRDRAYQDDFIGIAVDTFNDERRAFEFFVNPLGVQMDLTNNDLTGNEDDSWDAIWSSSGKIHSDRWEVEMAIPFSQIRFKESGADVQTWGIDIIRIYPREQRYRMGLHKQNRDRSCYVCQMSKLTGFRGITPGRNVEISPTVTTQRTDARPELGSPLSSGSFKTEPGVTTRWGMTPNLTLNAAINPDFSQVEADSAQLDINNTFALFFNEKRPFFLEGADFFDTPFSIVYTRTIAEPDWGAKLTGKEGNHGGGVFVARDAKTQLLIPGSQGSSLTTLNEQNLTGVLRYRRDFGKNANLGATFTARQGGDYSNRVGGIDGYWRVTQSDTLTAQVLTSATQYPDAVEADGGSGHAFFARYRHGTRNWYWSTSLENVSDRFRADTGFMPRVDYRVGVAALERTWWPKDGQKTWWSRVFWGTDWDRTEELSSGTVLEEELETWVGVGGPRQSFLHLDVGTRNRHFNGRDFDGEKFVNIYGEITPHKSLYAELSINAGDQIDFANTQPATRFRVTPFVRWRATRHLQLQLLHTNERLDVDGGRLYTADLSELRAVYQFNVRMFVRALIQYTDIRRNPSLYVDTVDARSKLLFPQLLFSYKVNPQTVLFVGYSSTRVGDERIDVTEADRTLFVKVGYAWAM